MFYFWLQAMKAFHGKTFWKYVFLGLITINIQVLMCHYISNDAYNRGFASYCNFSYEIICLNVSKVTAATARHSYEWVWQQWD